MSTSPATAAPPAAPFPAAGPAGPATGRAGTATAGPTLRPVVRPPSCPHDGPPLTLAEACEIARDYALGLSSAACCVHRGLCHDGLCGLLGGPRPACSGACLPTGGGTP